MKYDPDSWLKHPKESVYHTARQGNLISLSKTYGSPLLLVRWTRSSNTSPVTGRLEAEIISPLGNLAKIAQEFEISTDQQRYQFWQIPNDGLPFKIQARLLQNPKISTQLEIWEYTPLFEGASGINQSSTTTNNQGIINVSFSQNPPSPPASDKGVVTSTPAAVGSFAIVPANANRISGFGVNNTSKVVWVSFGTTPAAPSRPSTPVPIGGNFDIPAGYIGAIQAAVAPSTPPVVGTVEMTEFNQV